jgi:glutathione S-transferase
LKLIFVVLRLAAKEVPIPGCMQALFFCCCSIDALTRGKKREVYARLDKSLGASQFADRITAQRNTSAALRKLESCFESDDQLYLLGTDNPTAADFAAYGMLIRVVDTAFDAQVGPCYEAAFTDAGVPRLTTWYLRMKSAFPLRFHS